jgi:hypothetical protein
VKLEDSKDGVIKPDPETCDAGAGISALNQRQPVQAKLEEPPKKDPYALQTTYASAVDITYTPENSLAHGLEMLKNIKYHVNRLEVGSKLRKEVWLREIAKYAFFFAFVTSRVLTLRIASRSKDHLPR